MLREQDIKAGRITADMNFSEKVWAVCARIPKGKLATYADIGRAIGGPSFKGHRAVGHALNRNPYAPEVPCHRVVGATGALTGFAGGLGKKEELLRSEGVTITNGKVDLAKHRCPSL